MVTIRLHLRYLCHVLLLLLTDFRWSCEGHFCIHHAIWGIFSCLWHKQAIIVTVWICEWLCALVMLRSDSCTWLLSCLSRRHLTLITCLSGHFWSRSHTLAHPIVNMLIHRWGNHHYLAGSFASWSILKSASIFDACNSDFSRLCIAWSDWFADTSCSRNLVLTDLTWRRHR